MKKNLLIFLLVVGAMLTIPSVVLANDFSVSANYDSGTTEQQLNVAELSLSQLADRERNVRMVGGGTTMLVGGGVAFLGMINEEIGIVATGGLIAAAGGVIMLIPSKAEREYGKVQRGRTPEEREYLAYESLSYLSDMGFRDRMIIGITYSATSIYYLLGRPNEDNYFGDDWDMQMGLTHAGLAAYSFLYPSYPEKVYEKVTKEKQYGWSLNIGEWVGPQFTYNF